MRSRIEEVDFIKAVLISFMILFHFPLIDESYPYFHDIVYSFHMPGFLLISGYFANTSKSYSSFILSIWRLFLPYLLIVTIHTLLNYYLAGIVPMQQAMSTLSISTLVDRIFLHPANPYWYINTLIICIVLKYFVVECLRLRGINSFIVLGITYYIATYFTGMYWHNAMLFLIGYILKDNSNNFLALFKPSFFAIVPLIILFSIRDCLSAGSLASISITVLVICFLLAVYQHLPLKGKNILLFVGRNTFVIVLFSPFFTALSKFFIPLFAFDPSGFCYAIVAIIFTISGCLFCAKICDWLHISKFLFAKSIILQ